MNRTPYEAMMHEFCVDLGWCGALVDGRSQHVDDYLPECGEVTADQFVEWLVRADGEDPDSELCARRDWKAKLKSVFVKHMGAEVVSVESLQWE